MGVEVIITVISVCLTWKLEEDLTIPAFPVWHLVGPRQSSVGFSGLATTPVPVWKRPKISWNLSKLWNNWQYLAYLTLQLMLYHHRHPQPFHNVVIPLHRETSAYKSEMKIFMSLLLFLSCYSGHFWSAFLVLLLLAVKRSRRTTKSDRKCPEKGLEK